MRNIVVFSGSSHPQLTDAICDTLGIQAGKVVLSKFSNRETNVQVMVSVRHNDVYIVQTGSANVNDHLMELLILISGAKIASSRRVVAVIPCFPYARQPETPYRKSGMPLSRVPVEEMDKYAHMFGQKKAKKNREDQSGDATPVFNGSALNSPIPSSSRAASPHQHLLDTDTVSGEPVVTKLRAPSPAPSMTSGVFVPGVANAQSGYKHWTARSGTLIANLLQCAGADHIITMDLHDPQYQGFFDIPVDNLVSQPLIIRYIKENYPDYKNAVIVSPDAGGAKRATNLADKLGCQFALIHKERKHSHGPGGDAMLLVGDVQGKVCIMLDDIADTCTTITKAARVLMDHGATKIAAIVTHGILSGDAVERIKASALDELIVSNTVPQDEHKASLGDKLKVFDVGQLFAEAIRRVHNGESLSLLFQNLKA